MSLENFESRAIDRANRLEQEKSKIDEKNREKLASQRDEFDKEIEKKREENKKKVAEKKAKVVEIRKSQRDELDDLRNKMDQLVEETRKLRTETGKKDVEESILDLEIQQKKYAKKAEILQKKLDESSYLMREAEAIRQNKLQELEEKRLEAQVEYEKKVLEKEDEVHQHQLKTEKQLSEMDKKRGDEQKEMVHKRDHVVFNRILHSEQLRSSLSIEDAFHEFEQRCRRLRDRHNRFSSQFVLLEPSLLRANNLMLKGRKFDECDMEPLLDSLLKFKEQVNEFNSAGSTKEEEFQEMIGKLKELIDALTTEFNGISAEIDDFEMPEGQQAQQGTGILEAINAAKATMKLISGLMQGFNVIGRNHFQETLRLQMGQAQSSSSGAPAAIRGPPAYYGPTEPAQKLAIQ